ncbi:unnamed protein product [Closterium sp. NIES-64]|nr:unnamed protein product [Closterium sp. NIES-64]
MNKYAMFAPGTDRTISKEEWRRQQATLIKAIDPEFSGSLVCPVTVRNWRKLEASAAPSTADNETADLSEFNGMAAAADSTAATVGNFPPGTESKSVFPPSAEGASAGYYAPSIASSTTTSFRLHLHRFLRVKRVAFPQPASPKCSQTFPFFQPGKLGRVPQPRRALRDEIDGRGRGGRRKWAARNGAAVGALATEQRRASHGGCDDGTESHGGCDDAARPTGSADGFRMGAQGMGAQGMSAQGMGAQGMSAQGMGAQGMSAQGMCAQGMGAQMMGAPGATVGVVPAMSPPAMGGPSQSNNLSSPRDMILLRRISGAAPTLRMPPSSRPSARALSPIVSSPLLRTPL